MICRDNGGAGGQRDQMHKNHVRVLMAAPPVFLRSTDFLPLAIGKV